MYMIIRSGKNDIEKLTEIYAKENELYYNMILFYFKKFNRYQFESYTENKSNCDLVYQEELGSFNYIITIIPYKTLLHNLI